MAVAIFHPAMIASVAIRNASMMVPESHMMSCLDISARVRTKVAGIRIAKIAKIKRLFS